MEPASGRDLLAFAARCAIVGVAVIAVTMTCAAILVAVVLFDHLR